MRSNQHKSAQKYVAFIFLLMIVGGLNKQTTGQTRILDTGRFLLRSGNQPEWDEFANQSSIKQLTIRFNVQPSKEHTLSLVQYDVKQNWNVVVNDRKVGSLVTDANAMRVYFRLPITVLRDTENVLTILPASNTADDIIISDLKIDSRSADEILAQCNVDVQVLDSKTKTHLPSRVTIVDKNNILQPVGTRPADTLAIRPGFVYSSTGKMQVLLPAGDFRLYAGRGFEYGVDSIDISLKPGDRIKRQLKVGREVDTRGWVGADTHIHTLTHSGHGDASDKERAVTIAGEGIELPIFTEHNKIVDFTSVAAATRSSAFFTLATGDEVTTPFGHFNVFPLTVDRQVPDHKVANWQQLAQNLPADSQSIVILNHGRDLHNGFRPFDPKLHLATAGYRVDKWTLPANAMETVNSGALQEDPMRLFHDWFGMLNGGHELVPIGSSDSHDVSRYLVGQARTYIKADDTKPSSINVKQVIGNLRQGKVTVSFGLVSKISVNKIAGPGELASSGQNTRVEIEVLGPAWIKAERISLYANGVKIREEQITNGTTAGIKWKGEWKLEPLKHDAYLVAIAEGAGPYLPYWPIVKPFQPTSIHWTPYTIGCSGAVKIDGDNDKKFTNARDYAEIITEKAGKNLKSLFTALQGYDEAVAIQVASVLHSQGTDLNTPEIQALLADSNVVVQNGFMKFKTALKESGSRE